MKIGLISLGCPKNLVDSEVMLGLAQQAGHELTNDPSAADVLVVNTCAFIDSAKQESIDTILEMARHKTDGVVPAARRHRLPCGALSRRTARKRSRKSTPCSAPAKCRRLCGAIAGGAMPLTFHRTGHQALSTEHRALRTEHRAPSSLPTYIYDADTPRFLATPRHYAYIKIAEGCDYKCAFCIIPTLRGHYRSRPAESIVREAQTLAARGVKELLLISQDTTFYGIDRGERGALARLLRDLNGVDGLEWIRLLYLYPTTIDDETLAAMAECEKVCKYIDLPLQHASNPVLAAHEAARHRADVRPPPFADSGAGARRRPSHDVHRRFPGRDRGRRGRAVRVRRTSTRSTMWACSPTRTRKAPPPISFRTMCRPKAKAHAEGG